jgi:hypothetical protein
MYQVINQSINQLVVLQLVALAYTVWSPNVSYSFNGEKQSVNGDTLH